MAHDTTPGPDAGCGNPCWYVTCLTPPAICWATSRRWERGFRRCGHSGVQRQFGARVDRLGGPPDWGERHRPPYATAGGVRRRVVDLRDRRGEAADRADPQGLGDDVGRGAGGALRGGHGRQADPTPSSGQRTRRSTLAVGQAPRGLRHWADRSAARVIHRRPTPRLTPRGATRTSARRNRRREMLAAELTRRDVAPSATIRAVGRSRRMRFAQSEGHDSRGIHASVWGGRGSGSGAGPEAGRRMGGNGGRRSGGWNWSSVPLIDGDSRVHRFTRAPLGGVGGPADAR